MAKSGQARVLTDDEFQSLLAVIEEHRYPEKNALIMQISYRLGLRVQEISLLRVKEVADLGVHHPFGYRIKDLLVLPKSFTKGARAVERKSTAQVRRSVRFSLSDFARVLHQVETLAKAGAAIDPEDFYPAVKKAGGKTRELPIVDPSLISALHRYLRLRIAENPDLKPNNPLILNQQGKAYSANTLQDHMQLMSRDWGGFERSSSHSGRRSLATKLLHDQQEPIKTVQMILGHKDASTTLIYHELPEGELRKVLSKASKPRS